jgi:hypothetical protein
MKGQRQEVKPDLAEFLSFAVEVAGVDEAMSGCSISPQTPSNHMTPYCQLPNTPNPVISVYPLPPSSIFTLKIWIVIP